MKRVEIEENIVGAVQQQGDASLITSLVIVVPNNLEILPDFYVDEILLQQIHHMGVLLGLLVEIQLDLLLVLLEDLPPTLHSFQGALNYDPEDQLENSE